MRIGINTRFLLHNHLEGIGVFTHEICKKLTKLMPQDTFYFYFDRTYNSKFIYADNIVPKIIYPSARQPILWKLWFDVALPKQLKNDKIDLFISFDGYCSLNTSIPQIICVHDLAFLQKQNWIPILHSWYMKYYTPKFLAKANKIITVSDFSKNDIINNYNINNNKINVIYNASSIEENNINVDDTDLINAPYFLFIGAVHPRKNVLNLVKAFEIFKHQHKNNYKLIIIGRNAWKNQSFIKYINQSTVKHEIIWRKNVDDNQKAILIKNSFAITYLSYFEGFGIPLVEAMQFGKPIICSNTSSMPEIAKNAAIYVDPNNINTIANTMQHLTQDKNLYHQLATNAKERYKDFSWDKSAKMLMDIIQNLKI